MEKPRPTYLRALVAGCALLVLCLGVYLYVSQPPDIDSFAAAYDAADDSGRLALTRTYLKTYPVSELLSRVEGHYSDQHRVCHSQSHPIGRALYEVNQNFTDSIKQCGGACTYGCFHGVLMEMFKTDSDTLGGVIEVEAPTSYLSKVKDMARDLCTKPEVESVVRLRYCYHGLGHVFASIAGGDLSTAVDSCKILGNPHAVAPCATGVFMEYLFSASSSAVLNTKGEEPCDSYPQFRDSCYRYKSFGWLKVWNYDVHKTMAACKDFGSNELICIRSVAQSDAYLELVHSKESFERLCGEFTGDRKRACVSGALLRVIELNDGDDSDRACDAVEAPYHDICVDYLHKYHEIATF